jgi:hypothetical protein
VQKDEGREGSKDKDADAGQKQAEESTAKGVGQKDEGNEESKVEAAKVKKKAKKEKQGKDNIEAMIGDMFEVSSKKRKK